MYFLCCFEKFFEELGTLTPNKAEHRYVDPYRVNISRLFFLENFSKFMMKKVYQRIKLLDTKVDFSKFKDEKSNQV
jgi:hypothetical protein